MIIEKTCHKPLSLYSEQQPEFVHILLTVNDNNVPICSITSDDDWEMSFTGVDADYKFNILLTIPTLTVGELIKNGFKQYG